MGWLEGGLRIMPPWETHIWGFTISWNVFVPGVILMGLLFTVLGAYPFIEKWITGDDREHHLLQRPRNAPTRTGFGAAGPSASPSASPSHKSRKEGDQPITPALQLDHEAFGV